MTEICATPQFCQPCSQMQKHTVVVLLALACAAAAQKAPAEESELSSLPASRPLTVAQPYQPKSAPPTVERPGPPALLAPPVPSAIVIRPLVVPVIRPPPTLEGAKLTDPFIGDSGEGEDCTASPSACVGGQGEETHRAPALQRRAEQVCTDVAPPRSQFSCAAQARYNKRVDWSVFYYRFGGGGRLAALVLEFALLDAGASATSRLAPATCRCNADFMHRGFGAPFCRKSCGFAPCPPVGARSDARG